MAVTPFKLYQPTALLEVFAHAALKNLADGTELLSDPITSTLDPWGDLIAAISYESTAPAAGTIALAVYLLPAVDNDNFPTVGADGLPQSSLLVGTMESRAGSITALEYLVIRKIWIGSVGFKILISNVSGKGLANDDQVTMFVKLQRYQMGSGSA